MTKYVTLLSTHVPALLAGAEETSSGLRGLPEWLEEFTEFLKDTEVPAFANIFQIQIRTAHERGNHEAKYLRLFI